MTLIDAAAPVPAPLELYRERVRPEWIDYNEHMNLAFYMLAFDHATDALYDYLGIGADYKAAGNGSTFTLEAHITYSREMALDAPMRFETILLGHDQKRLHYAHRMFHEEKGFLAATNELVGLHVSLESRRSAPMPQPVQDRLARILAAHQALPRPPGLSRVMGLAATT